MHSDASAPLLPFIDHRHGRQRGDFINAQAHSRPPPLPPLPGLRGSGSRHALAGDPVHPLHRGGIRFGRAGDAGPAGPGDRVHPRNVRSGGAVRALLAGLPAVPRNPRAPVEAALRRHTEDSRLSKARERANFESFPDAQPRCASRKRKRAVRHACTARIIAFVMVVARPVSKQDVLFSLRNR